MDPRIKCVSDEEKFEIFAYKSSWVSVLHLILGFAIVKKLFDYGTIKVLRHHVFDFIRPTHPTLW